MINITLDGNSAELNVSDVTFVYNTDSILSEAIKIGWEGTRQERKAQQEDLAQNGKEYITEYTIDESALSTLLNELAAKLDITPVDAVVSFDVTAEQKIVITGGDLGKKVDIEKLAQTISENLIKQDYSAIAAPFEEIQPTVTKESAASQFVMISQYSSSYHSGNGASRVFNITKACGIINGTILQPGESFSANDKLGPRNGANGWKLAHAINNGEFVDEYGGGVCQVSSTLFNAVMMADLEITERYHHSWPIGYIPIGRDATISTGGPNFVFKNQYATPIYIVMYLNTEEERVYAEIYGAPLANGMTIQVTSKKTGSIKAGATKYQVDPSLPFNTTKEKIKARSGSYSKTYKEYYDKDGNLINTVLVYEDKYPAFAGLILISPDLADGGGTSTPTPSASSSGGGNQMSPQ
jgi:vancomycin resistance protein YoaR